MYGWKGKIGLLVPSVNTVVEPETNQMAPEGINIYAARMRNATVDVENTKDMLNHVNRATDELASAKMNVIAFACTAGSFFEGTSGEHELKTTIERIAGVPAVTTSGAVIEALRTLNLKKIVVSYHRKCSMMKNLDNSREVIWNIIPYIFSTFFIPDIITHIT